MSSALSFSPLFPGELVLVTGATGFIGSHVVEEVLKAGLRVRATARTEDKATKLRQYFEPRYGKDTFEVFLVPDMDAPGAYQAAIRNVQGVAHVASPVSFGTGWDVITSAVEGTLGILRSAQATPSVRRVVVTSSSVTLGIPQYDTPQKYTPSTWNDGAVKEAKKNPTGMSVYTASKYEAEKALWKFVETDKPHFSVATVHPTMTFGSEIPAASTSSTNAGIAALINGDAGVLSSFGGSHFFVNVTNVAQLHVEALINASVYHERLLAYHHATFTMHDMVNAILDAKPNAPLATTNLTAIPHLDRKDTSMVDNSRMRQLLGDHAIFDLEATVKQALASVSSSAS